MRYGYKWVTGFVLTILAIIIAIVFMSASSSAQAQGSGRTPVWRVYWCDNYWGCGNSFDVYYINFNQGVGSGYYNYATTYLRWPGVDNGVAKTIWFRTGYDDNHHLKINGQTVAAGGCCSFAYGYFTAKPGEIVKLEFWSDDSGGGAYIAQVAWDPDGDGIYQLVGGNDVGLESSTAGGGSYWYSSDITASQSTTVTSARNRLNAISGNQIWIDEKIGSSNNTVTLEQTGSNNWIRGLGGGDAVINGQSNNITVKQGDGAGKNLVELAVQGTTNNVNLWQARNADTGLPDGSESGAHYAGLSVVGNSNSVTVRQANSGASSSGHFALVQVTGNNNAIAVRQDGNNDKKSFLDILGSNNSATVYQLGTGNHYVDLALTGNGHTANITQTGAGSHRATVNLQNAGGVSNLTLLQQGSTGQQYSIMQQCANLSGCSVSITQGTGP